MISLIQHFEADFLWKVSLKILNSGIILKTFTEVEEEAGLSIPGHNREDSFSCYEAPFHK